MTDSLARKVLVADGAQRSTLAFTRSLGRLGVSVSVAEENHTCLASASKYCRKKVLYRSPKDDPNGFVQDIERELQAENYDMFLPMTDLTCYLVAQNLERLASHTKVPMMDWDAVQLAADKGHLVSLAQSLGVPVPETHFVETADDVRALRDKLVFPVVLKPRQSRMLTDNGWVDTSVEYAHSQEELEKRAEDWNSQMPFPMIQERIRGFGSGAFLLFNQGEPRATFFHRRLREKPPSGGVSVLREAAPPDEKVSKYGNVLLSALNWHGVAMVEFKYDERDGLPKLMEINPRFWGSLQLAIDAGVDFPALLYKMTTEGDVPPVNEYRVGTRTRWLLGDCDQLIMRLFKSRKKLNLPEGFPGRMSAIAEFFRYSKDTKLEMFGAGDIGPALHEIRKYGADLWKGLAGKFSRG